MSISTPSPESLKEKAKVIRKFVQDTCGADVSHSQCLELISQLFGFKDWNTASAASKAKAQKNIFPIQIKTVGDMKRALELFKDTDVIGADYEFKLGEFLDDLEDTDTPETEFLHEFSLSFEDFNEDVVTFRLKLEHASSSG